MARSSLQSAILSETASWTKRENSHYGTHYHQQNHLLQFCCKWFVALRLGRHQSQINRLLGVYDILSANNLRTAFKSEILRKGKVTHSYWNRQSSFGTLSWNRSNYLYMFPGTSRANSFRKWILHTLNKCNNKSHFNNPVKFLVCPK